MKNRIFSIVLSFFLGSIAIGFAQESTPYTIKKALRTAREHNLVLQSERLHIDMAKADVTSAKTRPNPTFEVEAIQITNNADFENDARWHHSDNRENRWGLSKPLQIAGQRKHKIDFAIKNVAYEEQLYSDTENDFFEEVALQWLNTWAAEKQLQIIQKVKIQVDSLVDINKAHYRNQIISHTDLMRSELLASQYNILLKSAEQEVRNEANELKLLLGVNETVTIDLQDDFLFEIPEAYDKLLEQAYLYRSDFKAAKTLSDVSDSNIRLQKSLAYPQPEVGIIYHLQHSIPHFGFSASIDLPFFDVNQGERVKSQLQKDQAKQDVLYLSKKIENEITIAYENYLVQKQNLEAYENIVIQSETILKNVKDDSLNGDITILDILEEQENWLEIQQEYYEVKQSFRQSYIQLLHRTGLLNQLAF